MEENIQEAPAEEEAGSAVSEEDIARLAQRLLDSGMNADEVTAIFERAVKAGDLPPEALDVAAKVIGEDEDEGKRLFGLDEQER